MKPPEIIIGIPKNKKLYEDTAPMREVLEFKEGELGNLRSPKIPKAVFRLRRVCDIAKLVNAGVYQLGIFCDDTALEEGVKDQQKVATCTGLGEETQLALMAKSPKKLSVYKDALTNGYQSIMAGPPEKLGVVTSYPKATANLLKMAQPIPATGQVEAIFANGEAFGALAAVDIVRSGKTAESFGLAWESLMSSRISLWKTLKVRDEAEEAFIEVSKKLTGQLKAFGLSVTITGQSLLSRNPQAETIAAAERENQRREFY